MSHERSLPGVRLSSVVGASLALCLCLSAAAQADAAAPSTCPGVNVVVHGTLQFVDVEGGCWQFVTDGGAHYEPIGAGVAGMCEGQPGTLVGCTRPDLASICQVGEIVEVTSFTPDSTVVHGATEFVDVVGGCWRFVADDGTPYEPLGGPPELYVDGACGTLTFSAACGLGSTCQVGLLVNVLAFDGSAHWTDLGLGLSGNTTPTLGGDGTLCAGQPLTLSVDRAGNLFETTLTPLPGDNEALDVGFVACGDGVHDRRKRQVEVHEDLEVGVGVGASRLIWARFEN